MRPPRSLSTRPMRIVPKLELRGTQTLPDGGDASTLPHLNEGYLVNVKQPGAPTYTAIANFDEYNSLNTAAINNAGTIVGFSLSWSVGADQGVRDRRPHRSRDPRAPRPAGRLMCIPCGSSWFF